MTQPQLPWQGGMMAYVLIQDFNPRYNSLIDTLNRCVAVMFSNGALCKDTRDGKYPISDYIYVKIHSDNKKLFDIKGSFYPVSGFPLGIRNNLLPSDFGMINNCRILIDDSLDPKKTCALLCYPLDSDGLVNMEFMIELKFYGDNS